MNLAPLELRLPPITNFIKKCYLFLAQGNGNMNPIDAWEKNMIHIITLQKLVIYLYL